MGTLGLTYLAWTVGVVIPYRPEIHRSKELIIFLFIVSWISWILFRVLTPIAIAYPFQTDLPWEIRLLLSGSVLSWLSMRQLQRDLPASKPSTPRLSRSPPVQLPNPPGPSALDP